MVIPRCCFRTATGYRGGVSKRRLYHGDVERLVVVVEKSDSNRLEMRNPNPIVWKCENRFQSSGNGKTDCNRLEMGKPNSIVWK